MAAASRTNYRIPRRAEETTNKQAPTITVRII